MPSRSKGMTVKTVLMTACAVALAGCASSPSNMVTLIVSSQPAGAYITPIGEANGRLATLTRAWQPAEMARYKKDANGCHLVPGYAAKWGSGAASVSPNYIAICGSAGEYTYILNRAPSHPGLDRDLEFALKVEGQMRRQAHATEARQNAAVEAAAAGFAGAMGAWNASAQQQRPAAPVRCVSKKVFERVETVCE